MTTDAPIPESLIDLTSKARDGLLDRPLGREAELKQMYDVLAQEGKASVLLLGPAGIGKTALAEGVALDVVDSKIPENTRIVQVFQLDSNTLLSDTMYRGQYEEKVRQLLSFLVKRTDAILFIDEIHSILGLGRNISSGSAGDFSQILKPALARGEIRCIGATTDSEYEAFIAPDQAFTRRFHLLHLQELSNPVVANILFKINMKNRYSLGFAFDKQTVERIVSYSHHLFPTRRQPDKAIDTLRIISSKVKENGFPHASQNKTADSANLARLEAVLRTELAALTKGDAARAASMARDCLGISSSRSQLLQLSDIELAGMYVH